MTGFASRPGTAVDPMCSTRTATEARASARRLSSSCARTAQAGSLSTMRMAGSKRSSRDGWRSRSLPSEATVRAYDVPVAVLEVIAADVTALDVDAIANAANTQLIHG